MDLSDLLSKDRGWGVDDDSFRCLERMKQLGQPSWFSLGDLDLATHLTRTAMLRAGKTLSEATAELAGEIGNSRARAAHVGRARLDHARHREGHADLSGILRARAASGGSAQRCASKAPSSAHPAPGVIESIAAAEAIIFAPSNPVTSIGPILAVPGIREALRQTTAPGGCRQSDCWRRGGQSGPAGALMKMMGWPSGIAGVAKAYEDFLDVLVADRADEAAASAVRTDKLRVVCTNTIMRSLDDKRELARVTLEACAAKQSAGA